MPEDYHRAPLYRLPAAHIDWLRAQAERTGKTLPAIVADALSEYRERHDNQEPADDPR